jgi:hypothetical protein
MTTPDYRAALAELVAAWDKDYPWDHIDDPDRMGSLLDRARALLAAPEVVGVASDEALARFTEYFCRNYPGPDTIIHKPEWHAPKIFNAAAYAIAHYGAHPAPVPVGERLPGVDDCLVQNTGPDGEPEWWCWFYRPGLEGTAEWRWNTTPRLSEWYGWQGVTYWLPHWALPLPEAQP